MQKNKVFVYGTLKKDNSTRGLNLWSDATYVGDAVTHDQFNLWDMGSFPAVTLKGNASISGEVWEVSDEVFESLDRIEGYPEFYERTEIETAYGKAWMYYIPDIEPYYRAELIEPFNNTASWRAQ